MLTILSWLWMGLDDYIDVGDGFGYFGYQHPLSFYVNIGTNIQKISQTSKLGHRHPQIVTNFKSTTSLSLARILNVYFIFMELHLIIDSCWIQMMLLTTICVCDNFNMLTIERFYWDNLVSPDLFGHLVFRLVCLFCSKADLIWSRRFVLGLDFDLSKYPIPNSKCQTRNISDFLLFQKLILFKSFFVSVVFN